MCRVLGVSRSGYYTYRRRGLSPRRQENDRLVSRIREIWKGRRRVYGSPRITAGLRSEGHRCGKNRIARLMRENGIRSLMRRRFRVTTRSNHRLPVAEDLVGRNFATGSINELWLSDITYIWTWEGWLYLAAVMNVHSRVIVGWALRDRLKQGCRHRRSENRTPEAHSQSGLDFPLRPGQSICRHGSESTPSDVECPPGHERTGKLFRQCRHGILLQCPETRTGVSGNVPYEGPSTAECVRVHRNLLQQAAEALVLESKNSAGVLS
jgi:transposase InsO family protein